MWRWQEETSDDEVRDSLSIHPFFSSVRELMEPLISCVSDGSSRAREFQDKKSLGDRDSRESTATVVTRTSGDVKENLRQKPLGEAGFTQGNGPPEADTTYVHAL